MMSFRTPFERIALAATLGLAACTVEVESEPEQAERVVASELGFSTTITKTGCTSAEKTAVTNAIKFLNSELGSTYKAELTACLASAYLLEYKGNSATKIVDEFGNASINEIRCVDATETCSAQTTGWAGCYRGNGRVDINEWYLNHQGVRYIAGILAHEFMHAAGYAHSVNDTDGNIGKYGMTVPNQVEKCIQSAGTEHAGPRKPNPWYRGAGTEPTMANVVGMHTDGDGCNCVYLADGYATCGATDYLTRNTNTYSEYTVPLHYEPKHIVGMTQTGSLVCTFFADNQVSCATQSGCKPVDYLGETRALYRYVLPVSPTTRNRYKPIDIVGMAGDDSNDNIFAWYKDGYVSMGTTDAPGSERSPYAYTLPSGYTTSMIVEMIADDSFVCAFYSNSKVSCGSSDDLDASRTPYKTKF